MWTQHLVRGDWPCCDRRCWRDSHWQQQWQRLKPLRHVKYTLLLLLLTACSTPQAWTTAAVVTKKHQFDSTRVKLDSKNTLTGIGVEFLQGNFGTIGYLTVAARSIPPFQGDEERAIVVMAIGEEKLPFEAHRLRGGQKLRLPDEATEKLLTHLRDGEEITLYLEGFMERLPAPLPAHL